MWPKLRFDASAVRPDFASFAAAACVAARACVYGSTPRLIRRPGDNRTISSKLGYRGFGKRARLTLTRLMPPIHAIPPARGRRGRPRRRPDMLYADHGYVNVD